MLNKFKISDKLDLILLDKFKSDNILCKEYFKK